MVHITTAKLRRVDPPEWAAYPGLSLLYDDPDSVALSGLEPLDARSWSVDRDKRLYDHLRTLTGELAASASWEPGTFCPLPRHTYHVTLCDGVNKGNLAHVPADVHDEVSRTLDGLPDSLLRPGVLRRLLADPEMAWCVWAWPISFCAEALVVWGHVLAARLVPADERSATARAAHERARADLAQRLRARLGVPVPAWRPHLSLGYFANERAAARASEEVLPRWQEHLRQRAGGLSVTFRSASVYGFTDMVSFWRLAH